VLSQTCSLPLIHGISAAAWGLGEHSVYLKRTIFTCVPRQPRAGCSRRWACSLLHGSRYLSWRLWAQVCRKHDRLLPFPKI